ncbi:unnamed protein product [Ranitomeya imitator]|uniref:Doublesex and mab-3 related transcription factor 2 n=1 Tax=Ranitomeya imitator TaxID=111125 RepID=A0ABN9LGJ8_9NEOB|nr:unnamed protein product [Ranitomeya imitator]
MYEMPPVSVPCSPPSTLSSSPHSSYSSSLAGDSEIDVESVELEGESRRPEPRRTEEEEEEDEERGGDGAAHPQLPHKTTDKGGEQRKLSRTPKCARCRNHGGRLLPEGPQALLSLERLSVRQLPAGGGEAAGDGGAGGAPEAASYRGYRPLPADSYMGPNSPLPAPVSDRMRKRRAFADKELENIMLEREYKEREMMEASQASNLFLPGRMVHAADYNSYKAAYGSSQADNPNKEFCNFLPTCLDLTMQYSGSGNVELISSNVSVATTYRQYPVPSRFLVWPKSGPITDALLYQQCLLNATAMQALKPGSNWDSKSSPIIECQPTEHDLVPSKMETQMIPPQHLSQDSGERSAFSPPKRNFSQLSNKDHLAPPESLINKISKEAVKQPLSLKYSPFHSLFQQAHLEKSLSDLKNPCIKDPYEEPANKFRECSSKENQKYKVTIDRYNKDFLLGKDIGTKLLSMSPYHFLLNQSSRCRQVRHNVPASR